MAAASGAYGQKHHSNKRQHDISKKNTSFSHKRSLFFLRIVNRVPHNSSSVYIRISESRNRQSIIRPGYQPIALFLYTRQDCNSELSTAETMIAGLSGASTNSLKCLSHFIGNWTYILLVVCFLSPKKQEPTPPLLFDQFMVIGSVFL